MLFGEIGERTIREGDHGRVSIIGTVGDQRVEAEPIEIGHERFERGRRMLIRPRAGRPFGATDDFGVVGARLESRRHRQHHPGEDGHRGWLEAERWRMRRNRIAVLGPADVTAAADLHLEQAGLTHAFEVRSYGVGVQPERVGDVGRRERSRRAGEFEVDRVPRVVAQRLEQVELRRSGQSGRRIRWASGGPIHIRRLHGIHR